MKMHWGSSLFVLVCLLGLMPLRLQFDLQRQKDWQGSLTLRVLWWQQNWQFPTQERTVQSTIAKKNHSLAVDTQSGMMDRAISQHFGKESYTFQAHWGGIAIFALRALRILARQLWLERLTLRCRVGFARADYTAYSYGLFWAALSILPVSWLKKSSITYQPDFAQSRQEVAFCGIIGCCLGQIMLMIISLLWLAVQMTLEQHRKEQMTDENGLRWRIDGNSNGKYQADGGGKHDHRRCGRNTRRHSHYSSIQNVLRLCIRRYSRGMG